MNAATRVFWFVAAVFLLSGGAAHAQLHGSSICESVLASAADNPSLIEWYKSEYPECFPGSNPSASQQQAQATSFQQIAIVSGVVASRFSLGGVPAKKTGGRAELFGNTGIAAGNGVRQMNVWGSASLSAAKYDGFGADNQGLYDSDIWNLVAGGDYSFAPNMVIGLSAALDSGNGYSGVNRESVSTEGYIFAPYFGWQINENLALDASLGFGAGEAILASGQTDSSRSFRGVNLSYVRWMGELQLNGRLGYLSATEDNDDTTSNGVALAGTGSKTNLDQLRLGAQAGYWFSDGFMPYLGFGMSHDLRRTTQSGEDWDDNAYLVSTGVNFMSLVTGTTIGLSYIHEFGRSRTDYNSLLANINTRF